MKQTTDPGLPMPNAGKRFLVSNDDGYLAPGINHLAAALADLGHVTVVAPDRDRSGASNSLTLDAPLKVFEADNGFYFTNGTPTDCVHLAITGLLEKEPDMVVSGVNAGANLGDDVIYSGTVAAAMEGRFLGRPAIAVSLVGCHNSATAHYETAVAAVLHLLKIADANALPSDTLLNVNVPNLPLSEIAGYEVTRLGQRHRSEPVIKSKDPRTQRRVYWVGPVGKGQDAGPGTDFYAIKEKKVSITPVQVDLTRYNQIESLGDWLKGV